MTTVTKAQRTIIIALIKARHNKHDIKKVTIKRNGEVHVAQSSKVNHKGIESVFVGYAADILADIKFATQQFSYGTI